MSTPNRFSYPSSSDQGRVSHYVQEHPDAAIMVALAAGTVVGLALSSLLTTSHATYRWRDARLTSGLGERLLASLEKNLPHSLSSTLGLHS